MIRILIFFTLLTCKAFSATIAIIDTGFDLDHDFLSPKILKKETDEEAVNQTANHELHGWDFHDNSHLKKPVIEDHTQVEEILLFRNMRAKGHKEGLSPEEFEWYSRKNSDKTFLAKVKQFKKHAHGTFVAGIALREGENISIFPIRGLNINVPVVAVKNDTSTEPNAPVKGKTPQEKFNEEINNSLDRISRKFAKICHYLSLKKIEVVNASYGITYKNIVTKFRETYQLHAGTPIDEPRLKEFVDKYFEELYKRGESTMKKYPEMLFVFSAGNSGLDNDQFHHYPSRIKLSNTITVAAMNGDFLATFSNYGQKHVDIGAPGVGILSLVPKVYSRDGQDLYSPASGTYMAAPYISNLAAQILNTNPKLKAADVKKIILETGEVKPHLENKLISGSIVSNNKALKAALLSRDMKLDEAIKLSKLDLIPMEDSISIGMPPAVSPEGLKNKVLESFPKIITPQETDDISEGDSTKESSSQSLDQEKGPQDNSVPQTSGPQDAQLKSADQVPSNQNAVQSPQPSVERPASSSEPQLKPHPSLPRGPDPSLQQ